MAELADENRPLAHSRNLTEWLDKIGAVRADRAEALELLKGIRGSVLVDDARHLVSPLTVPAGQFRFSHTAGAGVRPSCNITVTSRGGAYLTWLHARAASHRFSISTATPIPALTAGIVTLAPYALGSDLAPVSLVQQGNLAGAGAVEFGYLPNDAPYSGCPLWVPSGSVIAIWHNGLASSITGEFGLQEVP